MTIKNWYLKSPNYSKQVNPEQFFNEHRKCGEPFKGYPENLQPELRSLISKPLDMHLQ